MIAVWVAAGIAIGAGVILVRRVTGRGRASPPPMSVALDEPAESPEPLPAVGVAPTESVPAPADGQGNLGPATPLYAAAYEAYRAGDLAAAAAKLREARGVAPDRPEVTKALATVLESKGAAEINRGDLAAAAVTLIEVTEVEPSRATAWKALGYAQLRQGERTSGIASLERAAGLDQADAETRRLLGVALYRAGDVAAAAPHLRAARDADPKDAEIGTLLEKAEREAAAERGFRRADSTHFRVSFEGGGKSEQAGYVVSRLLEESYHRVGDSFGYYPPAPVQAILYPAEQFRAVTHSPSWSGALYDGKIRLPVGGLTEHADELARAIAHEYTHALVHDLAHGRAPTWLNEGLALESEGASAADAVTRLRAAVRGEAHAASLRQLEGSFTGYGDAEAQMAYAYSLAATDYLLRGRGIAAARQILERLGHGESLDDAMAATLYVSYDDFDRAFAATLR